MNPGLNRALAEATRLTRLGRLQEATEVIQGSFQGGFSTGSTPATEPTADDSPIIEGVFSVVERTGPSTEESATFDTSAPRSKRRAQSAFTEEPSERASSRRGRWSRPHPFSGPFGKPQADRRDTDLGAGGQFVAGTFAHAAGTRAYKLYLPRGHTDRALPLVVMLHGGTQNSDDFAIGTQMNALAEQEGCCVLYPEQSVQANPSRCWNWFKPSDQQRGLGEPALLADLTREMIRTHGLDEHQVYVAGLSAGGAMAMVLGVNYPDVYAAIGVHSGLPYGAAQDLPSAFMTMQQGPANHRLRPAGKTGESERMIDPLPAIIFHGDRDTTVHPGNGDQALAQWVKAYAAGRPRIRLNQVEQQGRVPNGHGYTQTRYHDPDGRTVLEHWTIHGAGHAWSGGSPAGSYTDPKGPAASEAMLRFFRQHFRKRG